MMSSKFGFRSGKCNNDWHQLSYLIKGWICQKFHEMAGPSDLSERACKHKVQSKKISIEMVSFPADIMPSLIIVKESEGVAQTCSVKKLFIEISQNSQEITCARVSFLIKLQV